MIRSIIITALLLIVKSGFAQFISNTGIEIHNSALLVSNGAWVNASATTIVNDGVIHIDDSFINAGTLDKSSRGGFVLDFATDANFQPGGSQFGFLTKKGTGAALLTGSINVQDSLLMREGLIHVQNPSDTVSLGSAAALMSGPGSFVQGGFVARAGKGDLVFPLGKDGIYLPLKIYKLNAVKATASVDAAPPGYTAGPGIDAMIGFPYSWKVEKKTAADTAAYIEVNYPTSLPVVSNPIVVRAVPGSQYASMGARLIDNSAARMTVKSYSRRLSGLFTVAQGFPSDPVTDSLALVSLYNSTGGANWTSKTNWLTGTVDSWFGVTVTGQSITSVELPGNNLVGSVADPLVDILSLQTVDLSSNKINALPNFTLNPEISSLNVSNNQLDFGSLEPNASVAGLSYLNQDKIGSPIDTAIAVGSAFTFSVPAGGASSEYQWSQNGSPVAGANGPTYLLSAIDRQGMGEYTAKITNPLLPGLTLNSAVEKVLAYAEVSGKLLIDQDSPAEKGQLTLYKVQPGAFEVVQQIPPQPDGSYRFEKVILDDYQIRGFADTTLYARALPTYYRNTLFWEEADTLFLENNIDSLDIASQLEPDPASGKGSISGILQQDDATGRIHDPQKNKRIAQAGVSARRVERTGRTKGEVLILVAYVFTNDDGEFNLPKLPEGEYRLNFQYPGYPMDETSYTTVTIGKAFDSQVMVEANVVNGKIKVSKLVITGTYEAAGYHADVYPNPAADHITLRFPSAARGRAITLMDLQGRELKSVDAEKAESVISIKDFHKGLYVLDVFENGRKVKTLKLSIE